MHAAHILGPTSLSEKLKHGSKSKTRSRRPPAFPRGSRDDRTEWLTRRAKEREDATPSVAGDIWRRSPSPPVSWDTNVRALDTFFDRREAERGRAPAPKNPHHRPKKKSRHGKKRSSGSSSDSSSSSSSDSDSSSSSEEKWVEKPVRGRIRPRKTVTSAAVMSPTDIKIVAAPDYGKDLLRGEGSAIAKYVREKKRIPRRGEVGISAKEIDKFESLGYVMSGNRNKRMTAVRLRKEGQVISAEAKREMMEGQLRERAEREMKIREDMQKLVAEQLKAAKQS